MKDRVATGYRGRNGTEFFQVPPNYVHSRVGATLLSGGQLARAEVIEDNDALDRAVFQERRDQMAADETRAAGNENALPFMEKIAQHDRQCWRAGQCQPQACSSLPVRFFTGRGRRKLTISQAIRINDPIVAITNDRVKWRGQ
jgi:hypothetical protein